MQWLPWSKDRLSLSSKKISNRETNEWATLMRACVRMRRWMSIAAKISLTDLPCFGLASTTNTLLPSPHSPHRRLALQN